MERIEIKSNPTGPDAPVEVIPDIETATAESTPKTTETQTEERPSWLPEKFETPEDLAKAYGELEKQFTQKAQAKVEKPQETKPDTAKAEPSDTDTVNEIVENAGLNMTDLSAEYEQSGQLSEDSYEKLEQAGISREYVDGYIRGQEALALQYQGEVFEVAGGQQGYTEMIQWAAKNLTLNEINAFNTSVNSGNLDQAKLSVQGLMAKYVASEGNEPRLVKGAATGDATTVFRSTAELTTAMKDPRYKSDPAYRQDVIEKLGRSSIF